MLFGVLKPLEEPALIFLPHTVLAESFGMLIPLQNVVGFFLGLFFVSYEPDAECLHPVPFSQLVLPHSWGRGSSL